MAPTHKRKRVQLSPEEEDDVEYIEQPMLLAGHDPEKEQEVWESFKDEHVEGRRLVSFLEPPFESH